MAEQHKESKLEKMTSGEMLEYTRKLESQLAEKTVELDKMRLIADNVIITPSHPEKFLGKNEDGEDVYEYLIDLPPHAGEGLRINGHMLYHGQKYTFTRENLLSIKDNVQRAWDHERSLHDDDENVYRPQMGRVLKGTDRRGRRH